MEFYKEIVNKCIQNENINEYEINASQIIKAILDSHFTFLQFVESLGEYLTDGNVDQRARGVRLLSDLILKLPPDFLKEAEAHMLTVFLCERIADRESVSSKSLKGLHNLLARHGGVVTKVEIGLILKAIFQDFFTQTRVADDRRCVFMVFQTLLQLHLPQIQDLGFEFVSGFIQAIDGEKDPRNLSIVFGLFPVVIAHFDIDPFVEQLFEVTACYFPIDFSPPPNDCRGIKREDLVLGLRSCLSSTPRFAEHCLPLLLEKMESDLESAKLDTFQTLEACAEVYGCDGLKESYSDIWKGVRREIFSSPSSSLEDAALRALTAVIKTACQGVVQRSSEDLLSRIVYAIREESVSYLVASDMNLIGPTIKLLSAVAMASISAYDLIVRTVVPLLLNHHTSSKEYSQRKMLVESLTTILGCHQLHSSSNHESSLSTYKSALQAMYFGILETHADSTLTAVNGLLVLANIPNLLTEGEIEYIGRLFAKYILDEKDESHRSACLNALAKLAELPETSVGKTLMNASMPFVGVSLDAENHSAEKDTERQRLQSMFDRNLHIITAVVKDVDGLTAVTPALLEEFENSLKGNIEWKWNPILQCFKRLAEKQELTKVASRHWCQQILLRLMSHVVTNDCHNISVLGSVSSIYLAAVPHLTTSNSLALILHTMKAYLNVEFVAHGVDNHVPDVPNSPESSQWAIVFVESVLNSVRTEVFNEELQANLNQFLVKSIALVEAEDANEWLVFSASRAIASVLNKVAEGEYLSEIISAVFKHAKISSRQPEEMLISRKRNLIHFLSRCTKALVLRGHPGMEMFISEMLVCLEDESISELIASGFQVILREDDRFLNTRCHANVRILYRQRFFLSTCPRLIHGFDTASEDTKYNFLTALVHLTSYLPREIVKSEIPSMLPLFIRGLLSESTPLLVALLSTLSELMTDSTDFAETYADTLISHLLRLSTYKDSMVVRIKALTCVRHLVKLPIHICMKHKQDVILKLGEAINDHKRLVRKEATAARSSWFLVGS